MIMTERELQMKYLILEDSYRKLEERVTKLEVDLELKNMLGIQEKFKNTSISLFLLRKDRERLAQDLGLSVETYESSKSLGESALEELIYNNKDVLNEFCSLLSSKPDLDDLSTDKNDNIIREQVIMNNSNNSFDVKEDKVLEDKVKEPMTIQEEIVKEPMFSQEGTNTSSKFVPMSLETSDIEEKKPAKRGRKPKAEKASISTETSEKSGSNVKSDKEIQEVPEVTEEFKDLDAALNMWN